ncbi:MAG: hypothetical protein HC923_05195 [Myxococcales bacterium]|nr:hypothetical protein [Myxococcales bacterium]
MKQILLVLRLAVLSLKTHLRRSAFVGAILTLGTGLVMIGLALLSSVESSMKASITQSLAGDLQVYSSKGRDRLALFGGSFMGIDDIGRVDPIDEAMDLVGAVKGVKRVVPMGIDFATISQPGELESVLSKLRAAVYDEDRAEMQRLVERAQELVNVVEQELHRRLEITSATERTEEAIRDVAAVQRPEFWAGFADDPLGALEVLDTKVAIHSLEGNIIYFRYVGTDIEPFVAEFDRFELIEGELIPPNTRGLLFNRKFYEDEIKHPVARDWTGSRG